jgi:Icc-related predicted phosphoesterase
MKILCISDMVDPLVYSSKIKERFGAVDLILSAGDLPMEYLSYIVTTLNKPLYFVFGNHNLKDLPYYRPALQSDHPFKVDYTYGAGATYVGFKVRREGNLIIMGLGGSVRYNTGLNQFSQAQMWFKLLAKVPRLVINRLCFGRFVDIVLTHAPPRGIHDRADPCHTGFEAFRWLMRTFKPRYLVHGHVHLYDPNEIRTTRFHDTIVLNAYSHHIIEHGDTDAICL